MNRTKTIRLLLTGAILAALSGLNACRRAEAPPKPVIRPVVTMQVRETARRERRFTGAARSSIETLLSFRVGGQIGELRAKLGLRVKKGDLIARLDTQDYALQVKQSQAQLAQTEALLQQAKAEYGRARQQYEANIVSKSELESRQAAYRSALAGCDAAAKAYELVDQQLSYCELRSPLDGTLAAVPVEVHQSVAAGQTVAALAAGGDLQMQLGLPESLIAQVQTGEAAVVTFDAVSGARFDARVSEIGVESDANGTYPVKLKLAVKDERIRPGMVGEAAFTLEDASAGAGTFMVPPAAVRVEPSGEKAVWVFQPSDDPARPQDGAARHGRVTRRIVTTGALTSDGLQITAGLEPDDIIVIRGVHQLQEGMQVRQLPLRSFH